MTDQALVPVTPATVQLGNLHASDAPGLIESAAAIATPLKALIDKQKLAVTISGRSYVKCEGWTAMAAMLGITPHEVSVTEAGGVFTAVVELKRMADGQAIARASAECGSEDEPTWAKRPRYARRSMALTRATAKAARLAFSWIIVLAGYEATPLEEMERDGDRDEPRNVTPSPAPLTPGPKPVPPPIKPASIPAGAVASGAKITKAQQKRLFAIAFQAGWTADEIKQALSANFGIEHTEEIDWKAYDTVVDYFRTPPEPGAEPPADDLGL